MIAHSRVFLGFHKKKKKRRKKTVCDIIFFNILVHVAAYIKNISAFYTIGVFSNKVRVWVDTHVSWIHMEPSGKSSLFKQNY